jgi:hypothetical protein
MEEKNRVLACVFLIYRYGGKRLLDEDHHAQFSEFGILLQKESFVRLDFVL